MVMIEKSLVIIIFMYATSFAALGMQYTLADSFGINLVGANGDDISSEVLDFIDTGFINQISNVDRGSPPGSLPDQSGPFNQTAMTLDPIVSAAGLVVEIFLLLTGTYIFNLLFYLIGIPPIWIAGFVVIYFFLLMRTIVAYLRGI